MEGGEHLLAFNVIVAVHVLLLPCVKNNTSMVQLESQSECVALFTTVGLNQSKEVDCQRYETGDKRNPGDLQGCGRRSPMQNGSLGR